jgi:arabinofuranosyltransferase
MHARLLLPAFFSLMMVVYITPAQLKSLLFAALAAWAIVCICYLRPPATSHPAAFDHGIANERSFWVIGLQQLHPISSAQWAQMGSAGVSYAVVAEQLHKQGHQGMVVSYDLLLHARLAGTLPVKVGSEAYLVVNVNNIGAIGYAAGPTVYVFDALSLANPIGSHMITTARTRPGHEKVISPLWMVGRFGKSGFVYTTNKTTASSIAAARQAITCGGLGTYLHDINTPLNWSQAWTDITHSLANTTLQYSADPQKAAKQLCH